MNEQVKQRAKVDGEAKLLNKIVKISKSYD